jgi:hypothetical protein
LRAERHATPEEVATVIWEAATDGSQRLRYLVGKDIEPLVKARREGSEWHYMQMMRSRFLANPARINTREAP